MSFDAFEPELARAFKGYDDAAADRFFRLVDRAGERLGVEYSGLEHVPDGAAILVMNHAFGWDAMLPMAALRRYHGRRVLLLGEHLWWKLPFVRTLAARVGTVLGTPQNVDELLAAGELVLLLPGGLREALKPSELRYRLLWGTRYGFVRAAIRNKAPLVPVAGIGADEVFELAGDAFARGRKWLRRDFPLPRPAWGLPIVHRRALRYMVGEPVQPTVVPGEDEAEAVRRIRREVRGAIEEMLDEELARRLGVHRLMAAAARASAVRDTPVVQPDERPERRRSHERLADDHDGTMRRRHAEDRLGQANGKPFVRWGAGSVVKVQPPREGGEETLAEQVVRRLVQHDEREREADVGAARAGPPASEKEQGEAGDPRGHRCRM